MEENKGAAEVAERKEGYYWVRVNNDSDWEVAKWNGDRGMFRWWTMIGSDWNLFDKELFEIDERQICRS